MEKKGWKILGIIFIILFALSCLIIYTINKELQSPQCPTGQEKWCVDKTSSISICKSGEQNICYDTRLQSATTCNLAENLIATCVSNDYKRHTNCEAGQQATCIKEGSYCNNCDTGYYSSCIKSGTSCNTCDTGFQSECIDKTKWGVWTGTYFSYCNAGQTANCK
jgi:hypothetical protein